MKLPEARAEVCKVVGCAHFAWANSTSAPAGGCDENEEGGWEHAPYTCGAETICGLCGTVMPWAPRRRREAPQYWSRFGEVGDVEVTAAVVRERQAAWQFHRERQEARAAERALAEAERSAAAGRAASGSDGLAVCAASRDNSASLQSRRGRTVSGEDGRHESRTRNDGVMRRGICSAPLTAAAGRSNVSADDGGQMESQIGPCEPMTPSPVRPMARQHPAATGTRRRLQLSPETAASAEETRAECEYPQWLVEAQAVIAASRQPSPDRAVGWARREQRMQRPLMASRQPVPGRVAGGRPQGEQRARRQRVHAFFAAARTLQQRAPALPAVQPRVHAGSAPLGSWERQRRQEAAATLQRGFRYCRSARLWRAIMSHARCIVEAKQAAAHGLQCWWRRRRARLMCRALMAHAQAVLAKRTARRARRVRARLEQAQRAAASRAAVTLQRSWRRTRIRRMCVALIARAQRVAAARMRLAAREAEVLAAHKRCRACLFFQRGKCPQRGQLPFSARSPNGASSTARGASGGGAGGRDRAARGWEEPSRAAAKQAARGWEEQGRAAERAAGMPAMPGGSRRRRLRC